MTVINRAVNDIRLLSSCWKRRSKRRMSQQPSRGPPYGAPSGWSPSGRPTAPSPFRPASPYGPNSMPYQQQRVPQAYYPNSPVPIGVPISPGMSPVFGGPSPTTIQCPRPRWPSPLPANATPRPYVPQPQVSFWIFCISYFLFFFYTDSKTFDSKSIRELNGLEVLSD